MLTVFLLNLFFFLETMIFFQDSLTNRKLGGGGIEIFCIIINIFTVTFNQLNASLLNKFIYLLLFFSY